MKQCIWCKETLRDVCNTSKESEKCYSFLVLREKENKELLTRDDPCDDWKGRY